MKTPRTCVPLFLSMGIALLIPARPIGKPVVTSQASSPAQKYSGMRIERISIPMKDGVRLAVNLYMPDRAKPAGKFPVILEYLPYRKDDWALERDYSLYAYFTHYGYVGARVDIRGTGASEGIPPDREYSDQEQEDGMEVIAWLAKQPWSNGNVGMMGISWGGFNSIQMAMRHPPALKAIISVDSTDELFHDDIHYIDGMMHADEFELAMDQELPMTSAPDFPVDEKSLAPRFDSSPWFPLYLHQQRDGPFWRRASLRPRYDRMQIPTFLIGGFYDGYRDVIPRMMTNVKAPVKALLGPWNHTYPHDAVPGPAIEWREIAVRWWDRWLKDVENGIETEPRLAVYMRHWCVPDPTIEQIPGEWRNEKSWPPAGERDRTLYLDSEHLLRDSAPAAGLHQLKYVPSVGIEGGFWWGEVTNDQRPTDAFSLVYDSPPLENDTAILGQPRVMLTASASAPLADWFARLSDVAPDGTVTLVTGAGLNAAQRSSSTSPADPEPGRVYQLEIELHVTSWVFPRGHRIRLAISNAMWPMIWPTPYAMTTSLALGGENPSRLVLPIVPLEGELAPPHFSAPGPTEKLADVESNGDTWPGTFTTEQDEIHHSTRVNWRGDSSSQFPWGQEKYHEQLTYDVADAHSDVSSVHGEADTTVELKGRTLLWHSALDLRSDGKNFYYNYKRELSDNGKLLRQKSWQETISRDHQ
ncbi:MAG: CocE/NonD family hydrolase [Candidatus Acidiferrales bacterium]